MVSGIVAAVDAREHNSSRPSWQHWRCVRAFTLNFEVGLRGYPLRRRPDTYDSTTVGGGYARRLLATWQSGFPGVLGLSVAIFNGLSSAVQTGAIVGRVSDATGAVVRGASVSVTDTGTSENPTDVSNSDGNYRVVDLIPGYRINVKVFGF